MTLNFIHWNPDPELVKIFGLSIRYYGLLFISGLILSIFVLKWMFKQEQLPAENLEKLSIHGLIGIFIGARLGHCLFYEPAYYLANPIEMLLPVKMTADGMKFIGYQGLASHGGGLGLILAIWIYSRKTKHKLIDVIDSISIVTPLAGGFIRLANLMNSEIVGIPTQKPWGFIFERIDQLPRHPAQLYESISYFLIFGILFFLYVKKRERLRNGVFFGLMLISIFTARIIIEFIKENQVDFEETMIFNMGQILSIPYLIVGIGFIIYGLKKTKSNLLGEKN